MNEDGALFDARFDDGGPFRDTPEPGGISLESALRDFGPAALDDLIPRVRVLARALDAAHRRGVVHGALNPSKIIITDEGTAIVKGESTFAPYLAPEVASGEPATAAADQFSLAAITHEWLFGKRIDGPAHRTITVKAMPGVDRAVLAKAFSRALAPAPEVRFATCGEFCDALAESAAPELPLLASDDDVNEEHDPVGPFVPEAAAPNLDDVKIVAPFDSEREDAFLAQGAQPDLDAIVIPPIDRPIDPTPVPFDSGREYTSLAQGKPANDSPRFSGMALIVATLVGAVLGFAAGYMARPRALQSGPAETFATQPGTDNSIAGASKPADVAKPAAGAAPANVPAATASKETAKTADAPKAAAKAGRLLVRSNPNGATVSVDGVEKGVTPLALSDVAFGTRNLMIARSGYATETRRVAISPARPSRSLDVRLSVVSKPASPKPVTPATLGKPAVTRGGLSVDSRPAGAAVTINGKPSGKTPLTIDDLPPGDYRIVMTMPGYRNFATTVRVVAGERVRAAYSLTAQEQE